MRSPSCCTPPIIRTGISTCRRRSGTCRSCRKRPSTISSAAPRRGCSSCRRATTSRNKTSPASAISRRDVKDVRLGVDIGGTFTDVALEVGDKRYTAKGLTTSRAPEDGVLAILHSVIAEAGIEPGQVRLIIHGTTLATNALIERKGARTALLTTEGFRDVVEIRHENRFEQYDLNIDLPPPLVPRRLRLPVRQRIGAQGDALGPLDEASVSAAITPLAAQQVEAVAVGLLHSFTNPEHERRVGAAIAQRLPDIAVTLSAQVSPDTRESEPFSTACANAYLQPLMGNYVGKLERELKRAGFRCPMLLMTSGGGITIAETAIRFPVRLVESGPAGGARFAGRAARQHGLAQGVW